jgi:hypothetical protein
MTLNNDQLTTVGGTWTAFAVTIKAETVVPATTITSTATLNPTQQAAFDIVAQTATALKRLVAPRAILENGQVNWTIERVMTQNRAAEWNPQRGMTYLVVVGTLHNYSHQSVILKANQIRLLVDGSEYSPLNGLMDRIKTDLNGMDFVGAYGGLELAAGQSRQAFVAFEVPLQRDSVSICFDTQTLAFNTASGIEVAIGATATPDASETALMLTGGAAVTQVALNIAGTDAASGATASAIAPDAFSTAQMQAVQAQQAQLVAETSVAVPINVSPSPTTSDFLPFDETTYAVKIMDTLFIGSGGRKIGTVRVANGRENGGEIVVIVPYDTTETEGDAQADEVFDILQSVGISISSNKLDVDSVSLIMGINGQASLIMVANADDVVDYAYSRITKQDMAQALEMTDLTK